MESLNLSFWLGLAAAVPLSVASNLVTPAVQRWNAKRSGAKSEKRIATLRRDLERVEKLAQSPEKLHTHLLEHMLFITLMTALIGTITAVLFTLSSIFSSLRPLAAMGYSAMIGGGATIAAICFDSLRDANRVRHIEKFRAEVERETNSLE